MQQNPNSAVGEARFHSILSTCDTPATPKNRVMSLYPRVATYPKPRRRVDGKPVFMAALFLTLFCLRVLSFGGGAQLGHVVCNDISCFEPRSLAQYRKAAECADPACLLKSGLNRTQMTGRWFKATQSTHLVLGRWVRVRNRLEHTPRKPNLVY